MKPVGSTDTATLAGESPHAQPPSDPDPSLQDWVRDGLSGLNNSELGGRPLMLAVSPDNCFIVLIALLIMMDIIILTGLISLVSIPESSNTFYTSFNACKCGAHCVSIGRHVTARYCALSRGPIVHRWSPALDVNDDPRMSWHSDPNNGPGVRYPLSLLTLMIQLSQ